MLKKFRNFLVKRLPDYYFIQLNYNYLRIKYGKFPRILNLRSPVNFSEKIAWLKLYHRYEDAHIVADKYLSRYVVEKKIGREILIPMYSVLTKGQNIDYSKLPQKFVIKPNNASGEIMFVDRDNLNNDHIQRTLNYWFDLDYGKIGREYQYSLIETKIVIEKDLSEESLDNNIIDYKFFCFNGKVKLIQIDSGRYTNHRRDFYDTSWNKLNLRILFSGSESGIEPPFNLSAMIDTAEILSQDFFFLRVDLYEIDRRVYFGEMTLHPGGGIEPIWPEIYDRILGDELDMGLLVKARQNAESI